MPRIHTPSFMTSEEIMTFPEGRKAIYTLALKKLNATRRMYQGYDEDVRQWYRSGEGREGYRYPYCIHGTSLTTDYDNICGGCEDGYTYFDYERDAAEAIGYAKNCFDEYYRRMTIHLQLVQARYPDPFPVWVWAKESISGKELQ